MFLRIADHKFLIISGNPDFAFLKKSTYKLKQSQFLSKYIFIFWTQIFIFAFRRQAIRSQELSNSDIGCFALAKFEKWHYSIYDSVTKKCYLLDLDTENPPNTGPGSDIASNFIGKV